ncbi:MAG: hypothetical protein Q8O52_03575 [Sulfuritalea sp.]|nr:hypothetical protein [Sulfuritalea sp.]
MTNNSTLTVTTALSGTGTLVNAGTRTLNIAGTSTITTLTATAAGNIVNYTGAGQTVKATSYATLNITGTATVSGTVTVATALGGAGTLTNAATGILNIGGSSAITGLTATAVGNVVNYTGAAAQTVKATTYATLNFSGAGVKTNSGATTVNTALTGTALANGATGILDIAGTSTITTLTATAVGNVVNYTGAAAQTIKATTYATLNTSGAGAKSVAGVTVVNNTLSVTGGTVTNNSTLTVTTALSGTGTLVNAGTRTLNIAGTSGITTLTATAAGNVVNYTGAAAQTVKATTYATLNFSGAGVKTNSGTTTVNTALTGTALTNDATGVLSIAGTSTITTLTATAVGNTVNYTGAAQTIKATTYHHLGLAGSLAKTAPAGLSVNGDLTFSGSATFTAGAFTHNFAGNWIVNTTAAAPLSVATTSIINFNTPAIPAATSMGGTTTATIAFADVNINNSSGVTFNDNASFSTGTTPTLTVAAGATLTPAAAVIVSGTGTLTGSGTVQVTRTAAVAGFSQQYTIANKTLTNLTVEYIGAAAQTVSALTYGKLKINNASGVTLAGATTVSTTLTLTDGGVATGANTLTVTGACPASVVVVGGYVVGAIRLTYPASATTTCTYPVGSSATAYTPIILAATTGAGGGTLTGSTTGAEHPQINTSDIDPTRSANRYWSLWSAGDSITLTSYDATFTFVAADVDVGAVPANFDIGKNVGGTWTLPTPVTATATTIAVTGIAGPLSAATAFVVGEGYALFVMSAPDGLGVVAGRPHRLRMTRTKLDGTTTLTGYTGAKNLDGWYAATGNHPGGATAPQVCLGNGTATPCLPATGGSCVTLPNAAPALNAGSNNLSITFASGVADFCVGTADVGQYAVSLRDDSNIAHAVTGTSSTLTARPFAVVVSGIVQGATANPASSSDSSANPFIAGANFSATVGGYLWKSTGTGIAGFGDADGDGVPDASPSFADVVTNGGGIAPRYADTVTLATDTTLPANFAPTAPPAAQGNLTGGTAVAVAAGSASTNTLKYSEVGSFTLKATPASDYLGGGVDLSPRVVIFADGATRNGWVGRFRPDHFVIAAGTSTPACGSFSYFGQDGFTTDFTLTAESADNATTTNYAGTWAKLGLTTWSNFAFAAATLPAGSTFAASTTPPTGTWVGGSAAVSAKHQLSRPTALTGLTSITISALPVDGDTVTLAAAVTVGSAPLRYGRLHLLAAYGSERLPLRVPVRAEYFNGTAWTLNAADSCTAIPQNSVVRATGGIAANLCFLSNPPPAAPTNSSCLAGGSPVLTLANGLGTWIVFDMTPVQVGIADLAVNLGTTGIDTSCNAAHPASVAGNLSWLQFPWCAGKLDPNARIKFGAAKAPYIYLRERY